MKYVSLEYFDHDLNMITIELQGCVVIDIVSLCMISTAEKDAPMRTILYAIDTYVGAIRPIEDLKRQLWAKRKQEKISTK